MLIAHGLTLAAPMRNAMVTCVYEKRANLQSASWAATRNTRARAGIPFVLEIWPAGHSSPIHNHGNAYGIVRMLHGDITGAHPAPLSACLPVCCLRNKREQVQV